MSDEGPNQSWDPKTTRCNELVETPLVVWYFLASLIFLFTSMLAGSLMALQLVHWNPLSGIELFSPGRWRMVQTNAAAYGFLANHFWLLYWAIPAHACRSQSAAVKFYFWLANCRVGELVEFCPVVRQDRANAGRRSFGIGGIISRADEFRARFCKPRSPLRFSLQPFSLSSARLDSTTVVMGNSCRNTLCPARQPAGRWVVAQDLQIVLRTS
jgi:hypothetical protein